MTFSFNTLAPQASGGFKLPSFSNASPFSLATTSQASTLCSKVETTPTLSNEKATSVGLGGVLASSTQSEHPVSTHDNVVTPMDASVPGELVQLVNLVKERIKTDRMAIDEISNFNQDQFNSISSEIKSLSIDCGKSLCAVLRTAGKAKMMREDIRHDLRQGEDAQCTYESIIPSEAKAQVQYLQQLCNSYEGDLEKLADRYRLLHKFLFEDKGKSLSADDLQVSLRKMNESFKWIASRYYETHDKLKNCLEVISRQNQKTFENLSTKTPSMKGPSLGTSSFKNSLFGITAAMKDPAQEHPKEEDVEKSKYVQGLVSGQGNMKLSNFFKLLNGAKDF